MSRTKKYLIQTLIFSLIFTILLVIGSIYDLQISQLLASNHLANGTYFSTNVFGRILEYFGSWPIFIFGIWACLIFMHKVYHLGGNKKYFSLLFIAIIVIVFYKGASDTLEYICENHYIEYIYEHNITKVLLWSVSLIVAIVSSFLYRRVDIEKNNNLFKFALVILCTCAFYILIELIKGPVGRIRFRAMNLINDFSYFTNWYQISDAKEILLNSSNIPKDGFKSFPSGHTFAAGVSYVLICMPYLFEKYNTRKWTIIWYLIPISLTGLVGLSRIVVGAHFLSDVLVGGTIAYIAAETFKYIFIVRKQEK